MKEDQYKEPDKKSWSLRLFADGALFADCSVSCCAGLAAGIGIAGRLLAQLLLLRPVKPLRLVLAWSISRLGVWNATSSYAKEGLSTQTPVGIWAQKYRSEELTKRPWGEVGESKEWPNWSWFAGGAAGGSRRARRLTESRLAQWPHLTVTVLNRLLHGTPT